MSSLRIRRPDVIALALAGTLLGVAHPGAASAAPDDALATAAYGTSEIWLQRKADNRKQRELVFQPSQDARPRVLNVTIPSRNRRFVSPWAENLGLGLDARGELTVVMQSNRGLYWTHVNGTPRMRRVPGTTKRDTFPSLFRGQLAYGRSVGEEGSVIRLGSLSGTAARTVWSNRSANQWVARDTAVGTGNTIAFVTVRDGAGNGAYQAHLIRPGGAAKRLLNLGLGDTHEGFLAIEGVTSSGRRLTITRRLDDKRTSIRFSLPTGRRMR